MYCLDAGEFYLQKKDALREIGELLWHQVGNALLGVTVLIHCQSLYKEVKILCTVLNVRHSNTLHGHSSRTLFGN
jgi:hypothetical protein